MQIVEYDAHRNRLFYEIMNCEVMLIDDVCIACANDGKPHHVIDTWASHGCHMISTVTDKIIVDMNTNTCDDLNEWKREILWSISWKWNTLISHWCFELRCNYNSPSQSLFSIVCIHECRAVECVNNSTSPSTTGRKVASRRGRGLEECSQLTHSVPIA